MSTDVHILKYVSVCLFVGVGIWLSCVKSPPPPPPPPHTHTHTHTHTHAPGMPGTVSPPPTSKETANLRSRHASRHSRRMRNMQIYVSGKRSIGRKYVSRCMQHWWHKLSVLNTWVMHHLLLLNIHSIIEDSVQNVYTLDPWKLEYMFPVEGLMVTYGLLEGHFLVLFFST